MCRARKSSNGYDLSLNRGACSRADNATLGQRFAALEDSSLSATVVHGLAAMIGRCTYAN